MAFFAIFRKILKSYSFIHVIIFRIFNQLKLLDQNMNANFSRPFFPVFFFRLDEYIFISGDQSQLQFLLYQRNQDTTRTAKFEILGEWKFSLFICMFVQCIFFVQGNTCFCGNLYLSDKFISTYLSIGNRYRFEMGSFYRAQNRINIRRYFWE